MRRSRPYRQSISDIVMRSAVMIERVAEIKVSPAQLAYY